MNENETDVIDGQVGTEYDYIGDVNLDNDPTIAFDGQQREWTYERLQKADEQGQLSEARDWSDDGVPLTCFKYTEKDTGNTWYCFQDWKSFNHNGQRFSVNTWRYYKPNETTNKTTATVYFPDGSDIYWTIPVCNRVALKQQIEAFIEWGGNEAGH